jgi:exodeoxyribonuclease V gamma subunit
MQGTPGEFRLYHSNALDVLAGLLAEELRALAPGQSLLAPDIVLIPQAAMRRWLQATLAQRHGVAANLEFLTPGEFVARALDANVPNLPQAPGKTTDDLDADGLRWRLYAALSDPRLRALPAMAQIAAWLADGDAAKAWSLAGELAGTFEKYSAWRRDWLLRWEAGADADDPQAILWRAVAAGRMHRARRIQDYLARFAENGDNRDALPSGLPSRLFAFAILNISPDVLRVLATQARAGILHFYLPTPSKAYWGDLQSLGARLHAGEAPFAEETDNPLLRDWGAAGRDFMALLGSYEVVHPSGEIAAYADPAEGASAGLLQRLQADLFHNRARPGAPLRDAVDRDDPGLQFHACHTRLRELQVLHDRLRALLEDPRFDPPLQPREIAVLAPDIDPYVPYLEAVFGGHGERDPIPYALADASPLADEPLADVFLRLLALPVSRFGLEDILDLLASPPLADANGLQAGDFERLRAWLRDAGARWGIDAAHRERMGAPADDGWTWQFALDRLLLGHASGDDDFIASESGAGVAPCSELEGSSLDALDRLLRLLRELARHARLLGEAMPPAQWREVLLKLLERLLPKAPATAGGQRALDRLRTLIDEFAKQAGKAGFEAPVPAEVLRAHFAAVLGEADTRAPLLTGGVSFARMVPMRLLPFRAICLLGMNDGDFPRRDPAAGLNRLTAELGTGQRRHGDRSTREDDRFLFLQLFASAQDAFCVSWLGADPRDGSPREPSVLVSELLAAAAAQHVDADAAKQQLVLRHPLQPFSPSAFGALDAEGKPDPRVFSYRGHWHPAAGRLSGARERLPPWIEAGAALAPPMPAETEVSLDALRRFLLDPAGQFLRQRLQLRLPEAEAAGEDIEPLQAPRRGLARTQLQREVFERLLAGVDADALQALLRARGLLPSGPSGRRALDEIVAEVAPYAEAFAQWRRDAVAESLALHVDIDGVRVHGRIDEVFANRIARLRFGEPNGPSSIRNGLDWLLARAAGIDAPFLEFHDADGDIGPHPREAIPREAAVDALRALLALRGEGLRRPLPFAPYSAWELFERRDDPARGLREAAKKWRGSGNGSWAEGEGETLRLALRGRDPFVDDAAKREFARVAGIVFGAVARGVPEAIDVDGIALPEDDAEDAA